MKAQIIAIGTEILIGQIIDTNSAWLAAELVKIGINVDKITAISDNRNTINKALKQGFNETDIIIFTGGLGPTNDDITKKTLAEYFNSNLIFSDSVFADVEHFLVQRGGKLNELNKMQALVPDKAIILPNKQGTAPGLLFEMENKICISLPGVPPEMKGIMNQYGFEAIKSRFNLPFTYYHTTLITDIAEAHLAEKLVDFEAKLPTGMEIAYLPSPGIVRLRLGLHGNSYKQIESEVKEQVQKLHNIIPDLIFGENSDTLEQLAAKLLLQNKLTLGTAESCTGGNIARTLTSLPGSSSWFIGSIVAYSNAIKTALLNVHESVIQENGAVSQEVVIAMAEGAKKQLKCDYSIATSGIAGPDGGSPEKPVGTIWIAVSGPHGNKTRLLKLGKERQINVKRTTIAALNLLRIQILNDYYK